MTDLINGLGGPVGFGEQEGPLEDEFELGPIDITSVFPEGLNILGTSYTDMLIDRFGVVILLAPDGQDEFDFFSGGAAEFFLFLEEHDPGRGGPLTTPGGTSRGSNAIWHDLDPEAGALTITFDDVGSFFAQEDERNAYQLRFIDISDQPGTVEGAFAVEYRYEAVNYGSDIGFDRLAGFFLPGPGANFFLGRGNSFELLSLDAVSRAGDLPDAGVIRLEFNGETVTTNQPDAPVIPLYGAPIEGTRGSDLLIGTDGADFFIGDRGRDTIRPGEGADLIDLDFGPKTIVGPASDLFGDELLGAFDRDRLLFEDIAFDTEDVSISENRDALIFDIDGDGTEDGRIGIELDDFFFSESSSVLTATARAGTYVGLIQDLPDLDPGRQLRFEEDWRSDANTNAYLRGDGRADFVLRLSDVSTTETEGLVLGTYTYDRDGSIENVQLLTTDVAAAGNAEYLLDGIGKGESIGVFLFTPDDPDAISGVDSFDFVNETGDTADLDDRSYIFASVDGVVVGGDMVHGTSSRLNVDLEQHALVGMSDLPGLTLAFEETLDLKDRSFDDVVLSIERLAVDLA